MKEMENWVDIVGFEGLYQVSDLGRVRSLDRGMYVRQDRYKNPRWTNRKGLVLKQSPDGKGYLMVALCKNGISKIKTVHRLVARHFVSRVGYAPVVNHLNSNNKDNRASNLEWCTIKENNQHTINSGRARVPRGSEHYASKISEDEAALIKKMLAAGSGATATARKLSLPYGAVRGIQKGSTWKYI